MKGPITRSQAPKKREGHKYTDSSKRGAVIALHQLKTRRPLTIQEIEIETGVPKATASRIIRQSKAISSQDDKENLDLDPAAIATPVPKPKSGRPFKFNSEHRAQVVAMAT